MYRQPLAEKIAALKTLLPLMYVHLAALQKLIESYPYEKEVVDPRLPPPLWALLNCDGRCKACPYQADCKGERWESLWEQARRQWRLDVIKRAYMFLGAEKPKVAMAVHAAYIDPEDDTSRAIASMVAGRPVVTAGLLSPEGLKALLAAADEGLKWLAEHIPGELTPLVPCAKQDRKRVWTERVKAMHTEEGATQRAIIKRLGGSARDVSRLIVQLKSAGGGECPP